jgi:hypothetical protein
VTKRAYLGIALLILLVLSTASGCGGQTNDEKAYASRDEQLAAWDNRQGAEWSAYARGWRDGWTDGCSLANKRAWRLTMPASEPYDPLLSGASACGLPPHPDEDAAPTFPPDWPRGAGREDGFSAGCSGAYSDALDTTPPRGFCERLALQTR